MIFYFDRKDQVNLSHIPEINEVRPYKQIEQFYKKRNAEFVVSKDYQQSGIYLVETSKLTHQWTNGNYDSSFSIIENLRYPTRIGIQTGVIRLVIISTVEGDSFINKDGWDGFRALTDQAKAVNLPKFSILVISGNLKVEQEYAEWCRTNNEEPYIEFIGACDGPWSLPDNERICNSLAREKADPYMFSSLNRAERPHRTEHLYAIARRVLLPKGLVSGGVGWNMNSNLGRPKYLKDVASSKWRTVLLKNYPKYVDIKNLNENNPANDINMFIYENSMLAVVTETFFDEPGLFITEKTWKPITVGSPQLVLGQPGLITYLLDNFNINIKFPGLDQRYDLATDPTERFILFHEALEQWCKLPFAAKHKLSILWDEQLLNNQKIAKSIDFKELIVKKIIRSSYDYFTK